jgi:hypothetical protein
MVHHAKMVGVHRYRLQLQGICQQLQQGFQRMPRGSQSYDLRTRRVGHRTSHHANLQIYQLAA